MDKKHSISIRMSEDLYKKLCYVAEKDRRTASNMAHYLILEHIRHFEALFGNIKK